MNQEAIYEPFTYLALKIARAVCENRSVIEIKP